MEGKWVFLVEKYKTGNKEHNIFWRENPTKIHTASSITWREAYKFANKKAKELGLAKFRIDTPKGDRFVPVDSNEGLKDSK
jgi:hypothetical protein